MAKTSKVKLEFNKAYEDAKEFARFYYSPPEPNGFFEFNGGGYMHIGVDPGKVNGKEIKTPIEEWVERWIKNELGTQ